VTATAWLVVADDLTGAGDCAAAFAARGYSSCIWLWGAKPLFACDVPVLETSSRHVDRNEAYRRVSSVLAGTLAHVFKKIDSTLLGNVVDEIRAARDATHAGRIILAPAHPVMGRTIVDGELLLHGQPLDPPRHVPTIEGVECHDSRTIEDLRAIVAEAQQQRGRLVMAGSGALAEQIAATLPPKESHPPKRSAERIAVIAGSTNPATRVQIQRLQESGFTEILRIDRRDQNNASLLAPVTRYDAVVIAGGDTARAVARHLGAAGVCVHGEAARGVPWGEWISGAAHGKLVATKAGGFGGPETLVETIGYLRLQGTD
jgi:uncharacterized protein YgbK (DUF1537 family)